MLYRFSAVTVLREVQSSKQDCGIAVTLPGIVMLTRPDFLKMLTAFDANRTLSFSVTDLRAEQYSNA